jgi:hypothetical protein
VGVVIGVVVAVMLTATYLTWLASRLDRLADRVDTVRIGLITQLGARAAAALRLAQICLLPELTRVALLAVAAHDRPPAAGAFDDDVTDAENALSRALHTAAAALGWPATTATTANRAGTGAGPSPADPGDPAREALVAVAEATSRVGLGRALYNDAVRDLRSLRTRRVVRVLRLAGGDSPPPYFEIDDVFPPPAPAFPGPAAWPPDHPAAGAVGPERPEPPPMATEDDRPDRGGPDVPHIPGTSGIPDGAAAGRRQAPGR